MKFNARELRDAYLSAYHNVYNVYPEIDKLNVFPVPDGDTGTNMNLTLTNAIKTISELPETANLDKVATVFARGLIMGARGNSGVIFSQIFKGFADGLKGSDVLTVPHLIIAFQKAQEMAYRAVMKPVEGTILTVIREVSEQINNFGTEITIPELFTKICKIANESLNRTPELLPVLKEVGVVDSGGYGLVKALEGMEYYFRTGRIVEKVKKHTENNGNNVAMDIENEEFGYCTEAIITVNPDRIGTLDISKIRTTLQDQGGKSIVAVADEDIVKVHVHTLQPGSILTYLQQFGEFRNIKVENMSLQAKKHVKTIARTRTLKNPYSIIALVPSIGIANYFKNDLNVNQTLYVGQSMNPSTDDFIQAIEEADAKDVFLLPNNSNAILAAQQAAKVEKQSVVHIVPTSSVPEGMVATISFDPSEVARKNLANMKQALKSVKTLSISRAVKTTTIDGIAIQKDDYLGIVNKKIVIANAEITSVISHLLERNISKVNEIVTIFAGEDSQVSEINYIKRYLDENFDVEYEVITGDQPIYNYIISIE